MRLLRALAILLALTAAALAQGTFPGNQPLGTLPVGQGAGAPPKWQQTLPSDIYFGSGRPWCDVRAKGAKGDGSTDDSAAFKACRVALDAIGGGNLYVPPGAYCLKTADAHNAAIAIAATAITVIGDGLNVSNLWTCGADISIGYANVVGSGFLNLSYVAKGGQGNPGDTTFGATAPAFKFDTACGICRIDYVRGFGGFYALDDLGFDSFISNFSFSYTYGQAIFHDAGNGHRVEHGALDQNWPVVLPNQNSLTISAWQASHAYSGNGVANTNVVSTQGYNIQLVSPSCTSGGSAPTLKNYGTAITDGTCTWQLVGATTYFGLQCDANCAELVVHGEVDFNCGGCTSNFTMEATSGGNAPNTVEIDGSSFGQAINSQILLHDGHAFILKGAHIATSSGTNAQALTVGNNAFIGSASIIGNHFNGPGSCISIGLPPSEAGYSIVGNQFVNCTIAIDYFNVAAALHITAGHNTMAAVATAFQVPNGSSFYEFSFNDVGGAAITYSTSDANQQVIGNDGAAIPNAALANPSMTVGGVTCTLGSACTPGIALTAGTSPTSGITSGNFISSTSNKVADSSKAVPTGAVVGTSDTQTLTNKTISGSTNTLSNIANASLTNSSVTVGGQTCTLGSTCEVRQFGSYGNINVAAGTTVFCNGTCQATQVLASGTLPAGQTAVFKNLNFNIATAPAAAQQVTATLFTGAFGSLSASALTCNVAAGTTSCTDATHSIALTAGQSYAWQIVTGATNATGGSSIGFEVDNP